MKEAVACKRRRGKNCSSLTFDREMKENVITRIARSYSNFRQQKKLIALGHPCSQVFSSTAW